MAERFERYREEVVRSFYEDHFSRFDRQIVLVDLLSALNAGPGHFADTQESLALILKSFRYGGSGLLSRLFAPRIDRLLFAVSKADHVAPNQHPALKQLLELMIRPAARAPRYEGITTEVMTLASLRCTDVVRTEHHGQVLSCVRGHLKDGERETVLFPGEIPPDLPEPDDWTSGRFRFKEFAPRRLVPSAAGPAHPPRPGAAVPDRGQARMTQPRPAPRPFELDPAGGATVVEVSPEEALIEAEAELEGEVLPPPRERSWGGRLLGLFTLGVVGAGVVQALDYVTSLLATHPLLGWPFAIFFGHGAVRAHRLRHRRDRRHAPPVAPGGDARRPPTASPPPSCTARPSRSWPRWRRSSPTGPCSRPMSSSSTPSATTP